LFVFKWKSYLPTNQSTYPILCINCEQTQWLDCVLCIFLLPLIVGFFPFIFLFSFFVVFIELFFGFNFLLLLFYLFISTLQNQTEKLMNCLLEKAFRWFFFCLFSDTRFVRCVTNNYTLDSTVFHKYMCLLLVFLFITLFKVVTRKTNN